MPRPRVRAAEQVPPAPQTGSEAGSLLSLSFALSSWTTPQFLLLDFLSPLLQNHTPGYKAPSILSFKAFSYSSRYCCTHSVFKQCYLFSVKSYSFNFSPKHFYWLVALENVGIPLTSRRSLAISGINSPADRVSQPFFPPNLWNILLSPDMPGATHHRLEL